MTRSALALALLIALATPARAEEPPFQAFQFVAERVAAAFTEATDGVRNVKFDIRRRDTAPEADVTIVGVLGMDIKPKNGPAWYSIRLVFGQRGRDWTYLKAYHELPGDKPMWTEGGDWYRGVAERAIGNAGR